MREEAAGDGKIGTTGRGIGPAYEDKVGRRAIRVQDLRNPATLGAKIDRILVHHNALRRGLGKPEFAKEALLAELTEVAPKVLPFADVTWELLDTARRAGKRILFEGAQGALLDIDHGTYPFVTSSNTVAAQAATGSGMGPRGIGYVLGIAKAYTTRVGSGPFPTELTDEIGERIGERGREFGTVTGRKRRCGWFDATLVRQTLKIAGIDGIALTKLDVLDGFEELKVGVGYMLDGERIDRLPAQQRRAGARAADLRDAGRLDAVDGRRALVERAAGAGGEIRALHRGADRAPGDHAVDQPRARRHHPDEGSVRRLIAAGREAAAQKKGHPPRFRGECPINGWTRTSTRGWGRGARSRVQG